MATPNSRSSALKHSLARRERLQNNVHDIESRSIDTLDNVLRRGHGAGDDMDIDFKPIARHAQRLADALLPIDHKFARQHMQNASLVWNHREGPRTFHGRLMSSRVTSCFLRATTPLRFSPEIWLPAIPV